MSIEFYATLTIIHKEMFFLCAYLRSFFHPLPFCNHLLLILIHFSAILFYGLLFHFGKEGYFMKIETNLLQAITLCLMATMGAGGIADLIKIGKGEN